MNVASLLFFALTILSPDDGAHVPVLKDGHAAYLSGSRAERFVRMDNAADRAKFLRVGSTQPPLRLLWEGPTNAVYELTVSPEGGGLSRSS